MYSMSRLHWMLMLCCVQKSLLDEPVNRETGVKTWQGREFSALLKICFLLGFVDKKWNNIQNNH